MKTIELLVNRGMQIIIDGQQPQNEWSFGDDERSIEEQGTNITLSDCNNHNSPFHIGEYRLVGLESDVNLFEAYYPDNLPTAITLVHSDGTRTKAKVVKAMHGDPAGSNEDECDEDEYGEEPIMVMLTTGKEAEIDEYTLYIKAEVEQ